MAITAARIWLDGAISEKEHAALPLMAHAAQRGSLVFDVGSFDVAPRGPALFRPRDHVGRFLRSARLVGLEVPFTEAELVDAAVAVVRANGGTRGLVRWSAFYAAGEPDLLPRSTATRVAVAMQALEDPPRTDPIRVAVFDDARKAAPDVLPPEAKAAAAYLGPMLARRRAVAAGADDVVLLDADGDVAEAPIANAFAVVERTLWTPPLGRILPGVTRDTVLRCAREAGIPVREERLPRVAFEAADEAFLTATSMPVAPIGFINGRKLPGGPITHLLVERVAAARRTRDAWLVSV